MAICPHEALAIETLSPADCAPTRPEPGISAEQAEQFLRSRRSIIAYYLEVGFFRLSFN